MIEQKFRAWDKEKKVMFEIDKEQSIAGHDFFSNDRFIPIRFTEHKDKNKKEIFAGDIMADCFDKTERVKRLRTVIIEVKEAMISNKKYLHPNGTFNGGSTKLYNLCYIEHQGKLLVDKVKDELENVLDSHVGVVELCEYDDGEGYYDQKHYGWRVNGLGKKYKRDNTLLDAIRNKEVIGNIYENPELDPRFIEKKNERGDDSGKYEGDDKNPN